MEKVKKLFQNDKFAEYLGIKLLEVSKGYAKAKLVINEKHINGLGTVQGGVIYSLADLVFEIASNSHGTIAVAVNASISYFKAVREGYLIAEGKEISLNNKLASYVVNIIDSTGDLVAVFQGMVYRKKKAL